MSWDAYRDTLIDSGHLSRAALCGLQDGSVWSASNGLNISAGEVLTLVRGFNNPSILAQHGVTVGGEKYMYIHSSPDDIHAKRGQKGLTIAKSAQCVLIGEYGEGMQAGNAAVAIGKMQDYLKGNNY